MDNEWELAGIDARYGACAFVAIRFVLDEIETLGENLIVDTETLCGRGDAGVFDLWNGRGLSFHRLEVGLAHFVKVSLGLLGATLHFAGLGLGSMALTETLRFDYAVAAFDPTVSTFVLQEEFVVVFDQELLLIREGSTIRSDSWCFGVDCFWRHGYANHRVFFCRIDCRGGCSIPRTGIHTGICHLCCGHSVILENVFGRRLLLVQHLGSRCVEADTMDTTCGRV